MNISDRKIFEIGDWVIDPHFPNKKVGIVIKYVETFPHLVKIFWQSTLRIETEIDYNLYPLKHTYAQQILLNK